MDDGQALFCCDGCLAAAQWIRGARLDDYYRLRDGLVGEATTARVGDDLPDYAAWDREDVLAGHAHGVPGGREITVLSDGMRCAACAWLIDRALRAEPGVLDAGANAVTGRIRIAWDPARTRLSPLLRRLAALGYPVFMAAGEDRERARRRERNRWIVRIGIAGLGAMQAMMFAEALYLDFDNAMPAATRDFLRWITVLVSAPVVFYAGWPFLAGMWREWRGRRLGMDTLIGGSSLLAWGASVVETVRGGTHVWFDAAVMFVFLLLIARVLEQRVRGIASAQVDALARARPALAIRETGDGGSEQVPVAALAAGDIVRAGIGEALPADGTLLADAGLDEALLTGESAVVHKRAGDPAWAGSICRQQPARLQVTRTGANTRLSQLVRLVEQAQAQRPPLARVADRIATWFVAALLLAAAAIYLWWRMHDPQRAFEVLLAVLVVSCPCALSLAIPAALAAAHGALARIGVLSLTPEALDRLARAQAVVFDKTGTLTDGRPSLGAVGTFAGMQPEDALAIAAALERDSGHPLAHAFAHVEAAAARDVATTPGRGIEGVLDGRRWKLGRRDWVAPAEPQAQADTDAALWLGDGATLAARFDISEALRADARQACDSLRAEGLRLEICSGDAPAAVEQAARALAIDQWRARQTPEDKLARLRALQAQGERVAMVGDGINDAPVLAGADVSLALADGAALAQRAADLVVTGKRLGAVPQAIDLARRTRRIIRENLAWALAYNAIALPLAATGKVTPWMAAIGMALSSLIVTLNALRLSRRTGMMSA